MSKLEADPQFTMPPPRVFSGTRIVLGLFLFGILATTGLWIYWKLHLAPFFPLQKALAEAFVDSSPRVEGGRHKKSPPTLRIVLQVAFTPLRGSDPTESMIARTIDLARRYQDLQQYELLEIYLVHPLAEQQAERLAFTVTIRELALRETQSSSPAEAAPPPRSGTP